MAEINFEKTLERLEKIVSQLEEGDLPLDEALKKYEEGIKLAAMCEKKLDRAKSRIELLMKKDNGTFEMKPFEEKEGS